MPGAPTLARPRSLERLDHVDGIRALAALTVYLNHAYAQVTGGHVVPLRGWLDVARFSMVAGHLSVTVFIVVSGFCLTLPVIRAGGELRGGPREFFKRRARRILPPYYAAVALCLALIWTIIGTPTGTIWDYPLHVDATAIVSHLLLLQDLFATSHINYVFWSIAVEWHIYFFVPLLVWGWRRYGASAVVLGTLLAGYAVRIAFASTRLARPCPHFLGMFALGMLAAYVARSDEPRFATLRKQPWALYAALALLAAALPAYVWGIRLADSRFYILDLPAGVMAACLLAAASGSQTSRVTRLFSWRPLVIVGEFSYSLYLIHAPLLQVLWQYVLRPLGLSPEAMFWALMSGGLLFVLAAAYGFFRLFEAPFMRSARVSLRGSPVAS